MDTTQNNRQNPAGQMRRENREAPRKRPAAQERKQEKPKKGLFSFLSGGKKSKPQRKPQQRPIRQEESQVPRQRPAKQEESQTPRQRPAKQEESQTPRQRPVKQEETQAPRQRPARQERAARPAQQRLEKSRKSPSAKPQKSRKQPRQTEPTDLSSKRRAYGNSKPKKQPLVIRILDGIQAFKEKRREARNGPQQGKRKKTAGSGQPIPVIIYTQPKTFNLSRLLIQMLTVAAVVAALVLGLSVFFKVETITVSGAETYSAWSVREASGIQEGDNLLTFSHARAGALIKANLPYVKTVRFGIKLPDTVNIIIEEEDVVYAIKDTTGTWWLMNSGGRIVEQANASKASNHTQVLGITLESPSPGAQAVATESVSAETAPTGESVPQTITGSQRLMAAMQILQALEDNGIVGEAASVDVTRLEDIILWYGSRYQVNLGDNTNLAYKISCMSDVILQLSEYESGILDISFTIWPDQVSYTPFT